MAGNEELLAAFKMFGNSMQEMAQTSVLTQATRDVAAIKSSQLTEAERQAKLAQVGQNFAGAFMATGGDAAKVNALLSQFKPKSYQTAQEAVIAGALEGRPDLIKAGVAADIAMGEGERIKQKAQQDFQASENAKDRALKEKLIKGRASNQKALTGDTEFKTNVDVALQKADELTKLVNKYGNYEVLNADASAKLDSSSYQLAINYAKIVDPQSVAREGEVAAAQKYLIPMGAGTRNSVTLAAIKNYIKTIRQYQAARAKAKASSSLQDGVQEVQDGEQDLLMQFILKD